MWHGEDSNIGLSDSKTHYYKHYFIHLGDYLDVTTNYQIKGKHAAHWVQQDWNTLVFF